MSHRTEVTREITAPVETVFARASDFARAPEFIEAITAVEMLTEGPTRAGTRFRETRRMFGKEASEEMEIALFEPPRRYVLTAESHGARYRSELRFEPVPNGTKVTFAFEAEPVTLTAKLMSFMMKAMIKAVTKTCAKDLDDLKADLEKA